MFATVDQISYATLLINNLGYDIDDYDLSNMSKIEISELIEDLKNELYYY